MSWDSSGAGSLIVTTKAKEEEKKTRFSLGTEPGAVQFVFSLQPFSLSWCSCGFSPCPRISLSTQFQFKITLTQTQSSSYYYCYVPSVLFVLFLYCSYSRRHMLAHMLFVLLVSYLVLCLHGSIRTQHEKKHNSRHLFFFPANNVDAQRMWNGCISVGNNVKIQYNVQTPSIQTDGCVTACKGELQSCRAS